MKIRQGYVSNSSSSSFVCLGIDITKNKALKAKFTDEEDCGELSEEGEKLLPENTDYHYYDSKEVLGWEIGGGSSDDGSFDCENVDLEELVEYAKALEKATGIKPKLMGGSYAC